MRNYIAPMTETQLQNQATELAHLLGFGLVYHPHRSTKSETGFPDLVIVGNQRELMVELKSPKGRLRRGKLSKNKNFWLPGQDEWLEAIDSVNRPPEAYLWRPEDWYSGRVEAILKDALHETTPVHQRPGYR